jgi:RND family efflux transporter MFP subunit
MARLGHGQYPLMGRVPNLCERLRVNRTIPYPHQVSFALAGFLSLSAIGVAGCSKAPAAATAAPPPPAVTVAHPVEDDIQDFEEFTGRVEGSQFVQIRARVSGYLDKIYFKPGTLVKEGDQLFQIDPRPYAATLEQAEGSLGQAKARLARLKQDLERSEPLVARKVMPAQEFDRIVGDNREAEAAINTAQAAVNSAKLNLEFTTIKAPIDGLVSREMITVGNLVQADQTILTTIVDHDPVHVYYDIDEATVLRLRKMILEGKLKTARDNRVPVVMALGDSEGFPYEGYVDFVDNRLDPTTGTIRIRAVFPNPTLDGNAVAITPGMFARVRVNLGPKYRGLLIAQRAVVADQGQKVAMVLTDDKNNVSARPLVLGHQFDNGMVVVKKGLQPGDRVIVRGVQRARPGQPVTPETSDMESLALK